MVHDYWKNHSLTIQTFVSKVMSLLFNTLSRSDIDLHLRRKHLFISCLKLPSAVILEPKKIKSVTVSTFSPSICHEVMGCHEVISWEICMQVKKQQLELDMEKRTSSKSEKEYVKAVYCHPTYLTYMQSTSCEIPGWIKHKLESRLLGEISITSDRQMTQPLWQKAKKNWEPLDESERGEWKCWLKTQHSKN